MFEQVKTEELFGDLSRTIAQPLLSETTYPWEALDGLKDFILKLGPTLPQDEYDKIGEDVWIHKSARVAPSASITGPLIVCSDSEIRHCAFIRGVAIVGRGAVVGNSTELKGTILFDGVQVPHYNYVGDSILGYKSHMGAGSITSNLKSDKSIVFLCMGSERLCTNRKKIGAILGDYVEVGCNSVLNPGVTVGKGTTIYPVSMVRGFVPANSIYKSKDEIVEKK